MSQRRKRDYHLPVREILSDLVAEQQALDQFLQKINIRDWKLNTSPGWDIQDTVSHLAAMEGYAHNAISEDGSRLGEIDDFKTLRAFRDEGPKHGRTIRPQDVIEWWRENRAKVVDPLSRMSATDRIPWFRGAMSAKTFATMRLAETWAYGLDIHDAVHSEAEDNDRLRHIAWFTWKTLPYAYERAGKSLEVPVRIEVMGPMYAKWVAGPEDAENVIKGQAGQFCRVAVGRLDPADADSVTFIGDQAEDAFHTLGLEL